MLQHPGYMVFTDKLRIDYSQQMVPVGMSDAQAADQSMHMSPMDLFDSIFWGMLFVPSPSETCADEGQSTLLRGWSRWVGSTIHNNCILSIRYHNMENKTQTAPRTLSLLPSWCILTLPHSQLLAHLLCFLFLYFWLRERMVVHVYPPRSHG